MYRRELLAALGALSLVPLSGCGLLRRETELDAYVEQSNIRYSGAAQTIEQLGSLDAQRLELLHELVDARQALLELLTDDQWQAVFP